MLFLIFNLRLYNMVAGFQDIPILDMLQWLLKPQMAIYWQVDSPHQFIIPTLCIYKYHSKLILSLTVKAV